MNIITIPKKFAQKDDLVIIPKKEYEEFLVLKKIQSIPTAKPTQAELRVVRRGQREARQGKYVEWRKLKEDLARRHY